MKSIASIKSKHQSAKEKYRKSALSNDDMKRISEKIEHIMKNESLFLNSALTLPKLADNLGISPHYLSQTFNTIFNVTFFDYINAYRIDYAKKQLNKKSNLNRSITEIAADSAFNSRSAFYSAFKKNVGMTPTQYKEIATQ